MLSEGLYWAFINRNRKVVELIDARTGLESRIKLKERALKSSCTLSFGTLWIHKSKGSLSYSFESRTREGLAISKMTYNVETELAVKATQQDTVVDKFK